MSALEIIDQVPEFARLVALEIRKVMGREVDRFRSAPSAEPWMQGNVLRERDRESEGEGE